MVEKNPMEIRYLVTLDVKECIRHFATPFHIQKDDLFPVAAGRL